MLVSVKVFQYRCEYVFVFVVCVVGQTISLSHLLLLAETNSDEPKPPPLSQTRDPSANLPLKA